MTNRVVVPGRPGAGALHPEDCSCSDCLAFWAREWSDRQQGISKLSILSNDEFMEKIKYAGFTVDELRLAAVMLELRHE